MPISKKYLKMFRSMMKQYCTSKYGKDGRIDKTVQGVPSCKKGRGVFYATARKQGIDYEMTMEELCEYAAEMVTSEGEEEDV